MTRTMWIAVFCLVTSIASIAIRAATPAASSSVEATAGHSKVEMATVSNESTKSDRLELPDIRAEAAITPAAQAAPVETPSTEPEAIKNPSRRWRDAKDRIAPSEPPRRRNITRKRSAGGNPPKAKAEAWHCRQDAAGSLLRSLDLSPRCNL
jgi:hypothetical protein